MSAMEVKRIEKKTKGDGSCWSKRQLEGDI